MEPSPLTHVPSNPSPKSSQKRTSSPGAPAPYTKKLKTGPGQGYSDKTKRRRKKKKLPITRESEMMPGLVQDVHFSSPSPEPLPSASCSAENRPSLIVPHSGSLLGGSSNPPSPVHSPPVAITSSSEAQLVANGRVAEALHAESKVRLSSLFSFDGVQTLYSPSTNIKPSLRALYRLSCVRSVLICSTSLSHCPHVVMSLVMAALSTGLKPINSLMG
jgi:hypothetical protein